MTRKFNMLQTKGYSLCFLLAKCLNIVYGNWVKLPDGCILGHDAEIFSNISNITECAAKCDSPDYPSCVSIEFVSSNTTCRFSPAHSQYPETTGSNVEVPCPEAPGIEYWQKDPVLPINTYPYIEIPNTCIIGDNDATIYSIPSIEGCWTECLAQGCKAIEFNSQLNECHLHDGSYFEFSKAGKVWSSPCAIKGNGTWIYRQNNDPFILNEV
ncbi:unnamed protein product [Owenia fusiformis]|uniref:Apple domain-containing protein n=1 Tax=Owenia fusiformis TaxID=6347 RepID=A0A8J1TBI2_OWEFU|nr:unnamed protein product [Owenia fusiformis]